jgi:HAD superfamily hydrolase (TIGR01509 family)
MAVLWDLDGVIVDSTMQHYQSWKETLERFLIDFSWETFLARYGTNIAELLPHLDQSEIENISREKEARFINMLEKDPRIFPGVRPCLERLSGEQVVQGIASSAPMNNIQVSLRVCRIDHYFHAIISGEDLPGKPDPAVYLAAAEQLGIEPANCLVIEDSPDGILGAKNAGMRALAVTTTRPVDRFRSADRILDTLEDLTIDAFCEVMEIPSVPKKQ